MTTSGTRIATQRSTAVEQLASVLSDANPVLGVMDFNVLDQLIEHLQEVYTEEWLTHTIAVSTMSLPGVLEHCHARGLSVQTAGPLELEIAQQSGFSLADIVHDAPVKTQSHLRDVTDAELSFSIDNFDELTRVDRLLSDPQHYGGTIGIRVTPQASADDDATTLAHIGIGLRDHREELIQAFLDRPWLTQLYVCFDTPPTTLQQTAEQVAAVYQFAEDIEHAAGAQRIFRFHLPAGIPVNLTSDEVQPTFDNHRFVHHAMMPEFFDGKYEISSEMTAPLTAKAGMILARVEYTKDLDNRMIAVVHAGAQQDPHVTRVLAYDSDGRFKDDLQHYYYDIAGPTGLVAQQVELPELEEGDLVAILDVGASAFGLAAGFTAPVYGIRADGLLTESSILNAGRSVTDVARTVGIYQPTKLLH
jgi:diaminopimelate decarboxylase